MVGTSNLKLGTVAIDVNSKSQSSAAGTAKDPSIHQRRAGACRYLSTSVFAVPL